eukprot:CAMPEP_0181323282 /NCGR_PEP_ID=MMETSP1101-20121128/19695_1 /TAXON_ID=46948 /ORGANISM="Rhodomonas abbreviata, Strain Caron Lab Isolate" /LENGTH=430 /DNA_ID=CAMNT_0023431285 /DNA_START=138 /DNA_END=1426 /DNA_ORIENTATION=+
MACLSIGKSSKKCVDASPLAPMGEEKTSKTIYFVVDKTSFTAAHFQSFEQTLKETLTETSASFLLKALLSEVSFRVAVYQENRDQNFPKYADDGFSNESLLECLSKLEAVRGDGWEGEESEGNHTDALKTVVHFLLNEQNKQPNKNCIVILSTDASSHTPDIASADPQANSSRERKALASAELGFDWDSICSEFHNLNLPVYSIRSGQGLDRKVHPLLEDCMRLNEKDGGGEVSCTLIARVDALTEKENNPANDVPIQSNDSRTDTAFEFPNANAEKGEDALYLTNNGHCIDPHCNDAHCLYDAVPYTAFQVDEPNAEEALHAQACNMCWQPAALVAACGNLKCSALACALCLTRWYRDPVQPGRMPLPLSHLACPFCRQPAARTLLTDINPHAVTILDDAARALAMDPGPGLGEGTRREGSGVEEGAEG